MKNKIICMLLVAGVFIGVPFNNVMAAQPNEKQAHTQETKEEIIQDKEVELLKKNIQQKQEKLKEEYMNLEITLPEEYIFEGDATFEESEYNLMASTYSTTSVPSGICTSGTATNTNLVAPMNVLNLYYDKYENDSTTSYRFGDKVVSSFILPGMTGTNVLGNTCEHMIPQGIDCARGYYFITAYCANKEHRSVIYVIDAWTNQYITTLVLAQTFHAGGIAYANGCFWICSGYDNGSGNAIIYYYNSDKIISAVSYAANNSSVKSVSLSDYNYGKVYLENQSKCSFIAEYKGNICVGEYYESQNGKLGFYPADPTNGKTLSATNLYSIPATAQGVDFYRTSSEAYMIVTSSYGIVNDSNIYVYKATGNEISGTLNFKKRIEMPCMVEEAVVYGGKTYFVFESCGSDYRAEIATLYSGMGWTIEITGKVCGFDNTFIFE